ncbi:MAG: TIGR04076 family protein [Candidatus Hodarchaeales archaeon]|jgi:uncharacterized repeat protein (TIGR04076 family)
MVKCKITVLKKTIHQELADEYCKTKTGICTRFEEGDMYIADNSTSMPEGFCGYAWIDLHRLILVLMNDGNFGTWMKDENSMIACCTDGIRPVVFKLERIED